jgi:membrane protease YdiL (CAAX protease family)
MNGFYYNYDSVIFETPEERENKIKRVKRLFSRIFLALFIYTLLAELLVAAIYAGAAIMLPEEQYAALSQNYVVALLISSASQYLVAFPVLALIMFGAEKAQKVEKTKLTAKDFLLFLLIAEVMMYVGNVVGNLLNSFVGTIRGQMPENDIATIVSEVPAWIILVLAVIVGPIVEELIFRKLMIDRLGIFGDRMAILFTSVAFGLMHANLYQFFYATLLGALLGYVYTRTRDVRYTMLIHMIVNFMGSIPTMYVQGAANEFYRLIELAGLGEAIDIAVLLFNAGILLVYTNMQYGMLAGGVFALWHLIKGKQIRISNDKEIFISDKDIIKNGVSNTGAILFIVISLIFTAINLFA